MPRYDRIVVHLRRGVKRPLTRRMQSCKDAALRVRYNIVLLYAEGRDSEEIASSLGSSTSTAIRVANRFLADGEAGLLDRRAGNAETKADEDMRAALVELLRATPQDYEWARPTWTLELLALTLTELTRTEISASTVRRMLLALGARWGTPRAVVLCPWSKRKKNRRIRELEALVETLPEDEVVLYQDEVDVHLNPKVGRDWMLPREQKVVITPGNNVKRCVAGGLNPKTGSIVLHFLPPYSPEHNPIERLWKELHANVTRNHRCKTIEEFVADVEKFLELAQPYPGAGPSLAKATTSSAA